MYSHKENNIINEKERERGLLSIVKFSFVYIIISTFILYFYDFKLDYNTLMFILLIPLMIIPFFLTKDILHPFIIFLITSEFLFVFNMIDVHIHKSSFRYGVLSSNYHDTAFTLSIFVIIIWYVFMYLGYIFSKRIKTKSYYNTLFKVERTKIIAWILIFIGVISYLFLFILKGGIDGMTSGLSGRVEAYAGLTYYIKLTGLITIGSLMLLSDGYKKTSVFIIIISFIMLASFGGRGAAFFGSIFPYLIIYHYRVKRLEIIKLIPLALISILFAIGLGNYRSYGETRINLTNPYDLLSDVAVGTQGGEILPSLIGSLLKGNIDYQYGSTLINILFAPIPSSIWTNKPNIDESGIVGRALMGEYNAWGLPPGPYGIAFFNFGFLGVIIFAFILGVIIYKLYFKFIINQSNNIGIIFYALIIASVFDFISTSAQINIIWYLIVFIGIKLLDILVTAIFKPINM